jgi:glycosyltransferase involved in cell wall biosynthesis
MLELLGRHGIDRGLKLWSRGVDAEAFHPRHRSLAWRRSLGVGDDQVVVALVRRLVKEKGLDAFAAAVDELGRRRLEHRSLVVGDGPERRSLAARLPSALFLGHLDGEALARAYASADVFVFPSDTETFGNVTLEAMASGLAVAAADATGSRSLVEPEVSGLLAPPGQLGEAVARLVADGALRRALAAAARARAERHGWDSVMQALEEHYLELLRPGAAPAGRR